MNTISDENIWITGGGSGIGRALAQQLAKAGNFVIISGRNPDALQQTKSLSPKHIRTLACDVSCKESMKSAQRELQQITDSLDRVFLSAGTCEYIDNFEPIDTDTFDRVFAVNFHGLINSINTAMPFLNKAQSRGHIISVSSMATLAPFPRAEAYGASKAAVDYFMNSLRLDLSQTSIDVTNVSPGFVDTPLTKKNDFSMPFLMDANRAVEIIIHESAKRSPRIIFPKRLQYMLMINQLLPGLWSKMMIARMKDRAQLQARR